MRRTYLKLMLYHQKYNFEVMNNYMRKLEYVSMLCAMIVTI